MKCKYPGKFCENRYFSARNSYCCRIREWKKKNGVCAYDATIKSRKRIEIVESNKKIGEFIKGGDLNGCKSGNSSIPAVH